MATACSTSFGISWKQIDGLLSSVIKGSTRLASVVSFQLVTQILCPPDHTTGGNYFKITLLCLIVLSFNHFIFI